MLLTGLSPEISKYLKYITKNASREDNQDTDVQNSRHQTRLLNKIQSIEGPLKKERLSLKSLYAGVIISDYGKTTKGKTLLTKASVNSTLLITTIQGNANNKSAKLIRRMLKGKFKYLPKETGLLNPKLSANEVRKQFRNAEIGGRLVGFFHELPGLLLLIKDYNEDKISERAFRRIFWASFGHNGPSKGFWEGMRISISGELKDQQITLHEDTPFIDKDGKLFYPNIQTHEAYVHTAFDREDQCIEGLAKLASETAGFADLKNFVWDEFLQDTQTWALKQIDQLKRNYNRFLGSKHLIKKLIKSVEARVQKFQTYLTDGRAKWTGEGGIGTLEFKHFDKSVEKLEKRGENHYTHTIEPSETVELHKPNNRKDFMENNVVSFLSRVVKGFNAYNSYH